ncbi:ribosome-associated protein IOJAP [Aurantiacibacter atlanticus]|uniref:Ribosomal silencing factor RsfS n=2 Tax=Aurantiacibacter atlanticus TaxID=1648404 RepID=A0A0H4VJK7_9SPHN|nr:ribosome-associated protein IOJAP [Aurantiacibacter atlanticus]
MSKASTPAPSGAKTPVHITASTLIPTMPDTIETIPAEPGSLHEMILQQLDDDQAQDVVSIPLEGKSSIADHMVIASGRSTRQVAAMAQKLAEKIKHRGEPSPRVEGLPAADWVLIDAGDVVVHLFRPEVRGFYNLERMWGFGEEPDAKRKMGSA